jgi:hypothetical protein
MLMFLVPSALALQYNGTPVVTFRADRPAGDYVSGEVELQKVRVHGCSGATTDVVVGAVIDPVLVQTVPIPAGNHCGLTFFWSTVLDIYGPAYTVRYSQSSTYVALAVDIAPKALSPYTVVAGTMSGGGPRLLVDVE